MSGIKGKTILGSLCMCLGLFFIVLYIDGSYLHSYFFGFFSKQYLFSINNYFGSFSLLFLSIIIITGAIITFEIGLIDKISVIVGYSVLISQLPLFFSITINNTIEMGKYGLIINRLFMQNGYVIKYVII